MILKKFARQVLFIRELGVSNHGIDVWFFRFAELSSSLVRFESYLSEQELGRAQAFRFERDRQRYIVFHGAMRDVLAHYLFPMASPKDIVFMCCDHGKPYVEGLEFNLSHSQDVAVLAVSRNLRLGIDIESVRCSVDCVGLAERFFHPKEAAYLKALSGSAQQQAFYQYWTAKEAFVKAVGEGVMFGFSSFCVDIGASCISWIAPEKKLSPHDWRLVFLLDNEHPVALVYQSLSCARLEVRQTVSF